MTRGATRRRGRYFDRQEGAPADITVSVTRRIQFSEVDALGIAWHGRYPSFFEAAATELGDKIGLTYDAYRRAGIGAPIAQLHIDYHRPLLLDDRFTVSATLVWCDAARLNTEFQIITEHNNVAATGYTVQMFYKLADRTVFWLQPELVSRMRERWCNGEFHDVG
jgi:acyl-CoA thioester hydrolase